MRGDSKKYYIMDEVCYNYIYGLVVKANMMAINHAPWHREYIRNAVDYLERHMESFIGSENKPLTIEEAVGKYKKRTKRDGSKGSKG